MEQGEQAPNQSIVGEWKRAHDEYTKRLSELKDANHELLRPFIEEMGKDISTPFQAQEVIAELILSLLQTGPINRHDLVDFLEELAPVSPAAVYNATYWLEICGRIEIFSSDLVLTQPDDQATRVDVRSS